ncbi:MAG: phosphatidate cytidylyltransferase [bacterium]
MIGRDNKSSNQDYSELFLRIIAIIVLAPLTLAIIWYGGRAFSALIAFLCVMLVFEWTRLIERSEFSPGFYILSFTAIFSMFMAAGQAYGEAFTIALAGGIISLTGEWLSNGSRRWAILGVAYVIMPCIALIWIRNIDVYGLDLCLFLFACVWATDISAFIVGKLIGGALLAPVISPGKTWAGALGGVAAAIIIGYGLSFFLNVFSAKWIYAIVAMLLGIITIVGDILESALKRHFGVKDSGGYIPGHGGLLDRLDGMILATVIFAIGILFWQTHQNTATITI